MPDNQRTREHKYVPGINHAMIKRPLATNWNLWLSVIILTLLPVLAACRDGGEQVSGPSRPTAALDLPGLSAQQDTSTGVVRGENLPGRLLFVQNGTIWLWQGKQGQALLGSGGAWQPAWSPNGDRIAYIERGESYSDLMLADANGDHLQQLTFNASNQVSHSQERIYESQWAFYPTWSPDSTRIALAAQYGPPVGAPAFEYNLALYTLPAIGGPRIQVYSDDGAQCGRMAYTLNGTALVYTRADSTSDGQQQIHRLDLNTGTSTPFPGAPAQSYDPALAPNGLWLAFAARDATLTDIWALPGNATDGSNPAPQRLTSLGTARAPMFSPDGQLLAFLAIPPGGNGFELWVAEVNAGDSGSLQISDPRQITQNMNLDADSGLSWAP